MAIKYLAEGIIESKEIYPDDVVNSAYKILQDEKEENRRSVLRIMKAGLVAMITGIVGNYIADKTGLNEIIMNIVCEVVQNLI